MKPLWIGNVISVMGNKAEIRLRDDIDNMYMNHEGQLFYIGQIGSYVSVKSGYNKIIGLVTQVKLQEIAFEKSNKSGKDFTIGERKVMEISLIGTIRSGSFNRGIDAFPLIGDEVFLTDSSDIDIIFNQSSEDGSISLAKFSQNRDIDVKVDINKLLSRHAAIVGSTGAGKSTTVASIVSLLAEKYEYPHIVIFDVHGEYAGAERFRSNDWCNCIDSSEFKLPYWILNYEDWRSILSINPENAYKQAAALKKTLADVKEEVIKGDDKYKDYRASSDIPIYFELDNLMEKYSSDKDAGSSELRLKYFIEDVRNDFITNPEPYASNDAFKTYIDRLLAREAGKKVTVIDLSEIPSGLLPLVVSVVTRIIFEFAYWNLERDFPVLLIYEEAHKYLSYNSYPNNARLAVEKVVKEGRKYGVSAAICSQRPSEISDTILSQCNNFITHRLSTEKDQQIVKVQLSDNLTGITNLLPILERGEAVVVGDSVVIPARITINKKFDLKNPDCDFNRLWSEGVNDGFDVEFILDNIRMQSYRKREDRD